MTDEITKPNLADMIRAEKTMSEEDWIERGSDATEALEAAGILVDATTADGYPSLGWFPHPDWDDRLIALGMSSEDRETVSDYVQDKWSNSLQWLGSLYDHGIERATKAYARRSKQQPDADLSTVEEERGNMFVILRNVNGELARYVSLETSYTKADEDDPNTWWRLEYVEGKQEEVA